MMIKTTCVGGSIVGGSVFDKSVVGGSVVGGSVVGESVFGKSVVGVSGEDILFWGRLSARSAQPIRRENRRIKALLIIKEDSD